MGHGVPSPACVGLSSGSVTYQPSKAWAYSLTGASVSLSLKWEGPGGRAQLMWMVRLSLGRGEGVMDVSACPKLQGTVCRLYTMVLF